MNNNQPNPQNESYQRVHLKKEAHEKLLRGAEILAEAVRSTMGPSGHSVIIDNDLGGPSITKDGVTVARSINLKNRLESMGAELLKEVASKTNDLAGDGTTTATVLAYELLKLGNKMINSGRSSIDIKNGMDAALNEIIEFLELNALKTTKNSEIVDVATISANGDKNIGLLIAKAIEEVGTDGIITIQPAKSVDTTLRVAEGIQVDSGYVSPYFITNNDKLICELDDPYILITANKINSISDIVPLLEQIDSVNKPLLIVADEIEGEALHTLVVNNTKGIIKCCAIKAPAYGEYRSDILADLGCVVGCEVLGATSELSLKKIKLDNLGRCKKAIISRKSSTLIVDDSNSETSERIKERTNSIRNALVDEKTSLDGLRQAKHRDRLAKLSGGIAVIEVGGSTEVEILEKKDRVEDAVNATQAAVQEGIVPGGGTALFYAAHHLKTMIYNGDFQAKESLGFDDEHVSDDYIQGVKLMAEVCEAPFKTIVSNTGASPEVVAAKLKQNLSDMKSVTIDVQNFDVSDMSNLCDNIQGLKEKISNQRQNELTDEKFKFGYNASTGKFEDLVESGILDPVKVTKHAIKNAVSVIGLVLTTEAVIVNE